MADRYEYRMKPFPKTLNEAGQIAAHLETMANQGAEEGWELFRVDSIGVTVPGGCFGLQPTRLDSETIVTFRRTVADTNS